ncbi:PDZ domain-containing protein [Streptomyces fimbriatus]
MEQTALRPKPMPGREPGGSGNSTGNGPGSGGPRPHDVRRRGRRLVSAVSRALVAVLLVLSGAGLGAMGTAVVGAGGIAELKRQAGLPAATPSASARSALSAPSAAVAPPAPVAARLGVEVADDGRPGALVVGVHVPGPGFSAGLVRGDVLLAFGETRVGSAADLARAVARARPGAEVTLTVRHRGGDHQRLTVVPGIVT